MVPVLISFSFTFVLPKLYTSNDSPIIHNFCLTSIILSFYIPVFAICHRWFNISCSCMWQLPVVSVSPLDVNIYKTSINFQSSLGIYNVCSFTVSQIMPCFIGSESNSVACGFSTGMNVCWLHNFLKSTQCNTCFSWHIVSMKSLPQTLTTPAIL